MTHTLVDELVEIRWGARNKEYYSGKGYCFTEMGDAFFVSSLDVKPTAPTKVHAVCDDCGTERLIERRYYRDLCSACARRTEAFREEKRRWALARLESADERRKMSERAKKRLSNPQAHAAFCETLRRYWSTHRKMTEDEIIRTRSYDEYREWRSSVFKRDGYQCKCCGRTSTRLNAHHVYNFHSHKELRTVVENGITLCRSCHVEFHRIYGKRKNGYLQLEEFRATKRWEVSDNESDTTTASVV